MSNFNARTISSTAFKLSARLTENLQEGMRDLGVQGLENFSGGGTRLFDQVLTSEDAVRETRKFLTSNRDKEREQGLKRVLAVSLSFHHYLHVTESTINAR